MISVKICGLREARHVKVACESGARYIGFMFFAKSPRYVAPDAAAALAQIVPPGVAKVAVTVDADNVLLDAITETVPLDMLQLHGTESPERVVEIRARYGLPVMKALGIADAEDLDKVADYEAVADQLLLDAKPPKTAELPGGNGLTFDWRLIAGRSWSKPWMLSGGLTPDNLAEAVRLTGAQQVDLSSGVETAPGVKDSGLIRAFLAAASD